ncbi:hypothetical protein MBLNU13_g11226t1 [Cladosporium sp. NU13]
MTGRQIANHDKEDASFSFVHIERPGTTVDQRVRRQVKSHDLETSSGTTASSTRDSSEFAADSQTTQESSLEEQAAIEKSFSTGSVAFRTIALKDTETQVGKKIAGLRLDVSNVMSFYRMISIIQVQEIDAQYGEITPGVISWQKFYFYIFIDPMLLTVAILLTVRHHSRFSRRRFQPESGWCTHPEYRAFSIKKH